MQFMIDHYRNKFPGCHIIVYDNMSTDRSVEIAKANNCEIIMYNTNDQICDSKYLEIKNNCWKSSKTDWVLICDMDELLEIDETLLRIEETKGTTIINSIAYNMVNMNDDCELKIMDHGIRIPMYDKNLCFNRASIADINYAPGCHTIDPIGNISYSSTNYLLRHYVYVNVDLFVNKYQLYASRLSQENLKNKWGSHYMKTKQQIIAEFNYARSVAVKIGQI